MKSPNTIYTKILFLGVVLLLLTLTGCWPDAEIAEVTTTDTLITSEGGTIRLIAVDIPQMDSSYPEEVTYGKKAYRLIRLLTEKKYISFRTDDELKNAKGEFLMYVNTKEGRSVNAELLRQGLAWYVYSPPNTKFDRDFIKFQQEAMEKQKGLWKSWKDEKNEYRASKKTKRFHHPSCREGWNIPAKDLEVFEYKWGAFWNGYAPAEECRYKLMWIEKPDQSTSSKTTDTKSVK